MSSPYALLSQDTSYGGASDIDLDLSPPGRNYTSPTPYTTGYLTSTFKSSPRPSSSSPSIMDVASSWSTNGIGIGERGGERTQSLSERATSLRRQSSVALSVASKCMPSGLLQRAGSVLGGGRSPATSPSPVSPTLFSPSQHNVISKSHLTTSNLSPSPARSPGSERSGHKQSSSMTGMTAIETATTWLGGLGLASAYPPKHNKFTARPSLSSHQHNMTTRNHSIREDELEDDDDDEEDDGRSEYSADSYDTSDEEEPSLEAFTLPSPLPTDPASLTALLHKLHETHQAQTRQLRRAYLESDALADDLEESHDRERVLEGRLGRFDAGAARDAVDHPGYLGRGVNSPPPLTPDIYTHEDEGSGFPSPSPSSLRTPSPSRKPRWGAEGRERDISPTPSVMSVLPEKDEDFFSIPLTPINNLGSKGQGLGLELGGVDGGMGMRMGGHAVWEENTRLKARVCELEEVVEGVLGMVG